MHILDIIGWACVGMIVITGVMHCAVDTTVRSANAAIITMFTMLALGSFVAGMETKFTEWTNYYGVVQSVSTSTKYPDGREIVFETPGIPKDVLALSTTHKELVYLCGELTCHHLNPGDGIYVKRKWAGTEDGWLIQDVIRREE